MRIFLAPFTKIGQSGGAGQWRVCYQRGLPCLVLLYLVVNPLYGINTTKNKDDPNL